MAVKFSLIKDNKIEKEVEVAQGTMILGREGDLELIKGESGISREHGKVMIFEEFLLYQDLNSTNGSWVEGETAKPGEWMIASYPTFLQLANVVIGIKQDVNYIPDDVFGVIAVFEDETFIDDFPLNKLGKSLVIGGVGGQLNLASHHSSSKPALVIETRQSEVVAYSISREFPVYVNGQEVSDKMVLKSQDEVRVDNYIMHILFFKEDAYKDVENQATQISDEERAKRAKNAQQIIKSLKSWEDGDFDATDVYRKKMAGKQDVFQKMSPLMATNLENEEEENKVNYAKIENRVFLIIFLIGVFILFALGLLFVLKK